jgi:nitrogen regulatory protein PII-like uncharacterized protein
MGLLRYFDFTKHFAMIPSISDENRQEALLLFRDPEVGRTVLAMGLNGIGGFYCEKCDIRMHSYIVSKKLKVYENRESGNGLLSPIFSESGYDFDHVEENDAKETIRKFDTTRDFSISVQKDMASQLIHGYAQLLATGYLTLEKLGRMII